MELKLNLLRYIYFVISISTISQHTINKPKVSEIKLRKIVCYDFQHAINVMIH